MLLRRTPLSNSPGGNSVPLAALSSLSAARTLHLVRLRAGSIGPRQFHRDPSSGVPPDYCHDAGLPSRARPCAPQLRPNTEAATVDTRKAPRNGITPGCPVSLSNDFSQLRRSSSFSKITLRPSGQRRLVSPLSATSSVLETRSTPLSTPPPTPTTPLTSSSRALHATASPPGMYTTSFAFFEALWEAGINHVFVNLGSDHPSIIEAMVKGQREKKADFPRIITCPNEVCMSRRLQGVSIRSLGLSFALALTPVSRWWPCPWQTAMPV